MNTWTIIYLNSRERYEDMIDYHSYIQNLSSFEFKAWKKKSALNAIWTNDLCDTGAMLYQLSYQANWELNVVPRSTVNTNGGTEN